MNCCQNYWMWGKNNCKIYRSVKKNQYQNISISFIEKPIPWFYKENGVRCDNYILESKLISDIFGIRDLDLFVNFNNFMLKYYNKKYYFDNYVPTDYSNRRYYTNKTPIIRSRL